MNHVDLDWIKAGCPRRNLSRANLFRADLSGANLSGVDLSGADLSGVRGLPLVVVLDIDRAIAAAITDGRGRLDMSTWHRCETTHCRAGWAVVLAGEAGAELERELGTNAAAAIIYAQSRPDRAVPNWTASNEEVLEELGISGPR